MNSLYLFLTGPGVWISFFVFFGGFIGRLAFLYGLSLERDRVVYNHASPAWGLKSIGHWLLPWGSASMRLQPVFTAAFFLFHLTLLAVPLFFSGHNILWDEAFHWSLWSMPDGWADALTVVFLLSAAFLLARRLARPEVRILTTAGDYALLVLTTLPFLTGFMAVHHWGPYEAVMILHLLSSEILLILIPFTKLGHVALFFFTRAFIGFEMGSRRGARAW